MMPYQLECQLAHPVEIKGMKFAQVIAQRVDHRNLRYHAHC